MKKKMWPAIVTALTVIILVLGGIFFAGYFNLFNLNKNQRVEPEPQPQQVTEKPAHVVLKLDDQTFDLDLKTIGYNGQDVNTTDKTKLQAWFEDVKKQVDIPAKDASGHRYGGTISPEQVGRSMDINEANKWLDDLETIINKPQEIHVNEIKPSVTEEDLQNVKGKLIGSYTTYFDAGNTNRTTNIKLASDRITNLILNPGETFSFNDVVGERTAAKGYKVAHVIVRGEFSEGIGGGICQVSSTLYNSVDEAGLKIVRRYSHSAKVTYVPPGRDATVSWGGPDFRFKNSLHKPVLIRIIISGGSITIKTYTVPGQDVNQKRVQNAPDTSSQMQVQSDQPTEKLQTDKDKETNE